MVQTFLLNGKLYHAKAFDFNMMCDLEEIGISLEDADKKPMSLIRTYIAMCMNANKEYAGKEIEAHLVNGGTFDDIMDVMKEEMEKSDFFRSIGKSEETIPTESQENTPKTSKKVRKTTEA